MRDTPRFFRSDLTDRERRVYGGVPAFFALIFLALTWPFYAWFAGIRPLILGMPLSMAYIVGVLLACFLVTLGLYLWEARSGRLGGGGGRRRGRADDGGRARGSGPPDVGEPAGRREEA